jgi:hypothetical protein
LDLSRQNPAGMRTLIPLAPFAACTLI